MSQATRDLALTVAVCLGALAGPRQTLRELADARGVLIGTAVRPPLLLSEARYSTTLAREFNMVEPEDAMKWWVVRPARDTFDFSEADVEVKFAEAHGMKVRGHTLVWGWSNPEWLKNLQASPAQRGELLHEHIARVAGHFRGRVFAWETETRASTNKASFAPRSGMTSPELALPERVPPTSSNASAGRTRRTRTRCCFTTTGGGETVNAKSDALFEKVRDFRKRGVPIDGVGLQMHIFDMHPDVEGIRKNIARFSALGVQVHITELDVALPVGADGEASAADLAKQADIYRQIVTASRPADVPRSRPGDSPTNGRGSDPGPSTPRVQRCCSTATMRRNWRTGRCVTPLPRSPSHLPLAVLT